jgi:zinc transport system permease protein
MVSLVVAIGIKIVGTLLVGALVIVPAAASKNVSSSLKNYIMYSSFFGGVSSVLGVYLSNFFNIEAGPIVIIIGTLIFLLAIIIKSINASRGN